ncbi:MopE-related protein, partial [Salinimicrobium sp. CAU 1759]
DLYGVDDPATNIDACENPGAGYASQAGDCNDNDPAINPGATEVCDGVDNNCDGNIDEGLTTSTWYADADEDDYGVDDTATNIEACENPGAGYASQAGDCNDNDPAINPGATEVCDGVDNDCDGLVDTDDDSLDLSTSTIYYVDADGDGYGDASDTGTAFCTTPSNGWSLNNEDCNDDPATGAGINPSATEQPDNGIDDDCDPSTPDTVEGTDSDGDGITDDVDNCPLSPNSSQEDYDIDGAGDACDDDIDGDGVLNEEDCDSFDPNIGVATTIYFIDNDKDGYGDESDTGETFCSDPGEGYSLNNIDCDDEDQSIYPGAFDIRGDGIDQDCDGKDQPFDCIGTDVLNIIELCSYSPDTERRWLVNNPAKCAVEVRWEIKKEKTSESFIAYKGDNIFITPVADKFPTQVVIYWNDSKGKSKKRTLASTGPLCQEENTIYSSSLLETGVTAYPNPMGADGFYLSFPAELGGQIFTGNLYDYNGRFLIGQDFQVPIGGGDIFWNLDHSEWDQGIYILKLQNSVHNYQIQLMKN